MPRQPVSLPTTAPLPPTLRVSPDSPIIQRSLLRLSRSSLIHLALDWLHPHNIELAAPSIRGPIYRGEDSEGASISSDNAEDDDEEDDGEEEGFYPRARSVAGVRRVYLDMQSRSGAKKDVAERIIYGDWRHGLSLYQLAMVDLQHLHEHPDSLKWSAYRIVHVKLASRPDGSGSPRLKQARSSLAVPRFHPSTFLQRLQAEVLPDSKTHFHFARPRDQPVTLLRVFILDSPYNTTMALDAIQGFDASRTIVIAFPDNAPYIYVSNAQVTSGGGGGVISSAGTTKKIRSLIIDGIPKALSRPGQMYTLKPTNLASKNLDALLTTRGPGAGNAAQGGWGIYADELRRASPLDPALALPRRPLLEKANENTVAGKAETGKRRAGLMETPEVRAVKKAKAMAKARFGANAMMDDGKGVERLVVMIKDPYPGSGGGSGSDGGVGGGDASTTAAGDQEGQVAATTSKATTATTHALRRRSRIGPQNDLPTALAEAADDMRAGDLAPHHAAAWRPEIKITFQGSHVFAGIRQLVEAGIVDGARMPGWMTGEEGVTVGVVSGGRVWGHRGSGL